VTAGVIGGASGSGNYGVYSTASGADAIHGVYSGTGGSSAVAGIANTSGNGVYGATGSTSGTNYAVGGVNTGGGYGGYFASSSSNAVYATGSGSDIIESIYTSSSGGSNGIKGISQSSSATSAGVYGDNTGAGYGVRGASSTGYGVYGTGEVGLYGQASPAYDVGVEGFSTGGKGVLGTDNGDGYGVYGQSASGTGVYAAVYGTGSNDYALYAFSENGGSSYAGYFVGAVYVAGSFSYSSDQRLKQNVQPLKGSLDQLLQLKGVTFEWKDPAAHGDQTGTQRGFIAQDVERVFPGWVGKDKDGFKTLDTRQIEALEVESIRTLKLENDDLKAEIAKTKDRLSALENGTHPIVGSTSVNMSGWAFGGLAFAGSLVMSRRKRPEARS
jgi:hypothetical protein